MADKTSTVDQLGVPLGTLAVQTVKEWVFNAPNRRNIVVQLEELSGLAFSWALSSGGTARFVPAGSVANIPMQAGTSIFLTSVAATVIDAETVG